MTFYLKYRPQNISELHLDGVRISLEKIASSEAMPHAFLFSGPKGTGKTSAARILAKVINCEHKEDSKTSEKLYEPCNKCEQCISITKGQNLDVIEIDAASHRGIEDIRLIREGVKLAPARSKKKIYIIDEAHMLTTEASNALLKTLEEPPDHVVFILATTNPEKLIDTIRSRVTNIHFKKATAKEIANSLSRIAEKEGIKIESKFFDVISTKADGSFRDAIKIFEQMVLEGVDFAKGIESFLSREKLFDIDKFLEVLSEKNAKEGLIIIEDSIEAGISARDMSRELIAKLRKLLLSSYGLGNTEKTSLTKNEIISLLKLISDASAKIQNSFIEQTPLEIALLEWCEGGNDSKSVKSSSKSTIEDVKETSSRKVEKEEIETPKKVSEVDIKSKNEPKNEKRSESVADQLDRMTSRSSTEDNKESEIATSFVGNSTGIEINDKIWRDILGKVGPGHTSTEALLRAAKPLEFDGSVLKLGVYYRFHKERLEEKQHRDILEEALQMCLGFPVRVICTLTEPPPATVLQKEEAVVVLTEPSKEAPSNPTLSKTDFALTQNNNPDIIKLAEEIFSN